MLVFVSQFGILCHKNVKLQTNEGDSCSSISACSGRQSHHWDEQRHQLQYPHGRHHNAVLGHRSHHSFVSHLANAQIKKLARAVTLGT